MACRPCPRQETETEGEWLNDAQLLDRLKSPEACEAYKAFSKKHALLKWDAKQKMTVVYYTRKLERHGTRKEGIIEKGGTVHAANETEQDGEDEWAEEEEEEQDWEDDDWGESWPAPAKTGTEADTKKKKKKKRTSSGSSNGKTKKKNKKGGKSNKKKNVSDDGSGSDADSHSEKGKKKRKRRSSSSSSDDKKKDKKKKSKKDKKDTKSKKDKKSKKEKKSKKAKKGKQDDDEETPLAVQGQPKPKAKGKAKPKSKPAAKKNEPDLAPAKAMKEKKEKKVKDQRGRPSPLPPQEGGGRGARGPWMFGCSPIGCNPTDEEDEGWSEGEVREGRREGRRTRRRRRTRMRTRKDGEGEEGREALGGPRGPSEVLGGLSAALGGHRALSEALGAPRRPSEAFGCRGRWRTRRGRGPPRHRMRTAHRPLLQGPRAEAARRATERRAPRPSPAS